MRDQGELPLTNADLPAGYAVAWVDGRNTWLTLGGSLLVSDGGLYWEIVDTVREAACPGCKQRGSHAWKCRYAYHLLTQLGADRRPKTNAAIWTGYWICRIDAHSFAPANALVNEMYALADRARLPVREDLGDLV